MGHHAFVTHSHFHRWDTTKEITHCTVLSADTTSVLQQHTQTHKFIPLIHTSIQVNLPADELNAKVLHFYLQRFFFTTVRFFWFHPHRITVRFFLDFFRNRFLSVFTSTHRHSVKYIFLPLPLFFKSQMQNHYYYLFSQFTLAYIHFHKGWIIKAGDWPCQSSFGMIVTLYQMLENVEYLHIPSN